MILCDIGDHLPCLCAELILLQKHQDKFPLSCCNLGDISGSLHLVEPLLHAKQAVLISLLQDNEQIHEASTGMNWVWFAIDSCFLGEQLVN